MGHRDMNAMPRMLVLMFVAYRHAEQRILARLQDAGFTDLTIAQLRVAARIDEAGSRLTELAAAASITKQTAGFLVDQLEKAGYVRRAVDPADGRARLVQVAERGAAAGVIARAAEAEIEDEWQAHLGGASMAELRTALAGLRDLIEPGPGGLEAEPTAE